MGVASVIALASLGLATAITVGWLYSARRRPRPYPSWLGWTLANPCVGFLSGSALLLDRLKLAPGMRVLDVGCGPGRLTLPAARRVGPDGRVVALDIQAGMLRQLERRAARSGLTNIDTVLGGIGRGLLGRDTFDRALLVTVLGEVVDREAALREIYAALKPGGVLSVAECLLDPDYQSRRAVRHLAEKVGFHTAHSFGNVFAFMLNFTKPGPGPVSDT